MFLAESAVLSASQAFKKKKPDKNILFVLNCFNLYVVFS